MMLDFSRPDYRALAWLFAVLFIGTLAALAAVMLTSPCPDTAQLAAWCKEMACAACFGNVSVG